MHSTNVSVIYFTCRLIINFPGKVKKLQVNRSDNKNTTDIHYKSEVIVTFLY